MARQSGGANVTSAGWSLLARAKRPGMIVLVPVGAALCAGLAWAAYARWRPPESLPAIERRVAAQQWGRAERELGRFLRRHPNDPAGLMLLARVLGGKGDLVGCARLLERFPAGSRQRVEALFRAAQAWEQAHRRRDAERAALDCLGTAPVTLEGQQAQQQCRRLLCGLYAVELRRRDLHRMAWQLYDHALPRQRHEALAMMLRAEFEMVEPQKAIAMLADAIKADPDDWPTRRATGLYQLEAGQVQPARATLYRCVQERPGDVTMWEAWLQCLHKTGDSFGLRNAVAQLPPAAEESALCWKFRALAAERAGNLDQALGCARRAYELEPTVGEHCHRLGLLLVRTGQRQEGKRFLERNKQLQAARQALRGAFNAYRRRWAAQPQQRGDLAYQVAQAYEQLGRRRFAMAWYRAALSEQPTHDLSIAGLERLQQGAPPASR